MCCRSDSKALDDCLRLAGPCASYASDPCNDTPSSLTPLERVALCFWKISLIVSPRPSIPRVQCFALADRRCDACTPAVLVAGIAVTAFGFLPLRCHSLACPLTSFISVARGVIRTTFFAGRGALANSCSCRRRRRSASSAASTVTGWDTGVHAVAYAPNWQRYQYGCLGWSHSCKTSGGGGVNGTSNRQTCLF